MPGRIRWPRRVRTDVGRRAQTSSSVTSVQSVTLVLAGVASPSQRRWTVVRRLRGRADRGHRDAVERPARGCRCACRSRRAIVTRCQAPSSQRPGDIAVSSERRSTRQRPDVRVDEEVGVVLAGAVLHRREPDRLAGRARADAEAAGEARTGAGPTRARPAGATRTPGCRWRRAGPTTRDRPRRCVLDRRPAAASQPDGIAVGEVGADGRRRSRPSPPRRRVGRTRARPRAAAPDEREQRRGPMRPAGGGVPPPVVGCPGTSRSEQDARRWCGCPWPCCRPGPAASSPA